MASVALRIIIVIICIYIFTRISICIYTHTYIEINIASLTSNASRHCNNENVCLKIYGVDMPSTGFVSQ